MNSGKSTEGNEGNKDADPLRSLSCLLFKSSTVARSCQPKLPSMWRPDMARHKEGNHGWRGWARI